MEEQERLIAQYSIDDYVKLDESNVVNSLLTYELPKQLKCDTKADQLHPLTVVVSDSTKQLSSEFQSKIFLTSDLAGPSGGEILREYFAGKNA